MHMRMRSPLGRCASSWLHQVLLITVCIMSDALSSLSVGLSNCITHLKLVVVVQMMTAPINDQMYKAVTGFAIMACLAVACIHVPVQLAKAVSPGLFPLHLKVSGDRVLLDS